MGFLVQPLGVRDIHAPLMQPKPVTSPVTKCRVREFIMAEWIVSGESSKQDGLLYVVDSDSAIDAINMVARRVWSKYHACGCFAVKFDGVYFITSAQHEVDKHDLSDPSWCWWLKVTKVEQGKNLWKP